MFSVITPTYNRAHLIEVSIKSVINQTHDDWEYIIVDDASTDNTSDIVKPYLKDPRIKYVKLTDNRGNACARNVGVLTATGEWVTFLDSDDEYHPEYLTNVIDYVKSNDVDFLWTGVIWKKKGEEIKRGCWSPNKSQIRSFFYQLKIGTGCGLAVKNKVFETIRFDDRLRAAVDTDFLLRVDKQFTFGFIPKFLVTLHSQGGSVRKNFNALYEAYKIMLSKYENDINSDDVLINKWYYKTFRLSIASGENEYQKYLKKIKGKLYLKAIILIFIKKIFPGQTVKKIYLFITSRLK